MLPRRLPLCLHSVTLVRVSEQSCAPAFLSVFALALGLVRTFSQPRLICKFGFREDTVSNVEYSPTFRRIFQLPSSGILKALMYRAVSALLVLSENTSH
jgi:hypothetical protein